HRRGERRRIGFGSALRFECPDAARVRCLYCGPYTRTVPRADGRLPHEVDPHDTGPQDACGVFGVWAPGEEAAKLTYFGLYALQHRGQQSAGIAVSNADRILVYKYMGLVCQVGHDTILVSTPVYVTRRH